MSTSVNRQDPVSRARVMTRRWHTVRPAVRERQARTMQELLRSRRCWARRRVSPPWQSPWKAHITRIRLRVWETIAFMRLQVWHRRGAAKGRHAPSAGLHRSGMGCVQRRGSRRSQQSTLGCPEELTAVACNYLVNATRRHTWCRRTLARRRAEERVHDE